VSRARSAHSLCSLASLAGMMCWKYASDSMLKRIDVGYWKNSLETMSVPRAQFVQLSQFGCHDVGQTGCWGETMLGIGRNPLEQCLSRARSARSLCSYPSKYHIINV
jgi:hypothetical protein